MKWLATTEFAILQRSLQSGVDELFDRFQEAEVKDPISLIHKLELTNKSKDHLVKAMRIRICHDVLNEILDGTIKLKTERHAQEATDID